VDYIKSSFAGSNSDFFNVGALEVAEISWLDFRFDYGRWRLGKNAVLRSAVLLKTGGRRSEHLRGVRWFVSYLGPSDGDVTLLTN
jgi:hypothetical protein